MPVMTKYDWIGLPESWRGRVDATLYNHDSNKYYFFRVNKYASKSSGSTQVFSSEKNLSEFGGNFLSSWKYLDAATYNGDSNKYYFFSGSKYLEKSSGQDFTTEKMIVSNWGGVWEASWQVPIQSDVQVIYKDCVASDIGVMEPSYLLMVNNIVSNPSDHEISKDVSTEKSLETSTNVSFTDSLVKSSSREHGFIVGFSYEYTSSTVQDATTGGYTFSASAETSHSWSFSEEKGFEETNEYGEVKSSLLCYNWWKCECHCRSA